MDEGSAAAAGVARPELAEDVWLEQRAVGEGGEELHEAPVAADAIVRKGTAVATRVATRQPKLTENRLRRIPAPGAHCGRSPNLTERPKSTSY
jgi:hypothetical protein